MKNAFKGNINPNSWQKYMTTDYHEIKQEE